MQIPPGTRLHGLAFQKSSGKKICVSMAQAGMEAYARWQGLSAHERTLSGLVSRIYAAMELERWEEDEFCESEEI